MSKLLLFYAKKKITLKKKLSITDESGVEDNRQKSSTDSSRRNSTLPNTSSKQTKPPNTSGQSSTEAIENSETSSPGSSASALMRKSRMKRSSTIRTNKGKLYCTFVK